MEQVWPQCFAVLPKTLPSPSSCPLCSQPLSCQLIPLVGLCLEFWALHFKSYHFSRLPKSIWRAAHPLLPPSVRGHLVPVTDGGWPVSALAVALGLALVAGHSWPYPFIPTLAFLLCKVVTGCPKPCNNKCLFLYLGLVGQCFSFPEQLLTQLKLIFSCLLNLSHL